MGFQSILFGLSQSDLVGPLFNLGAVGICLIALATYFISKDRKYEKRVDEMLGREEAFRKETASLQETFRKEQAEMAEKYRAALERFAQALDLVTVCIKNIKGH